MHPPEASSTTSTMEHRRSQLRMSRRLKIIQQQAGHDHASTTSIYTCVSSDYRTRTLRRALDATIEAALKPARRPG
jgi:hypothetical protein